jgi:hypothetical protein
MYQLNYMQKQVFRIHFYPKLHLYYLLQEMLPNLGGMSKLRRRQQQRRGLVVLRTFDFIYFINFYIIVVNVSMN